MNRLLWGIAFLVLAVAGGWAQSTWRGQAEVWVGGSAPLDGFVVASNEFPRNSQLTVENYRTKKTIQVRVVAALPSGSSALVVLSPKAAQALEIKVGETPLVGVRLDPNASDRPDNPDPDVNPLAAAPAVAAVPAVPIPAPVPVPAPGTPGTPAAPPATLMPLPTPAPVEAPEPSAPLAVADEPEPSTPVTPGKKVFLTTRESEPVAAETPAVTEPETPMAEAPAAPEPVAEVPAEAPPVAVAPVETPAPAMEPPPVEAPAPVPVPVAPVAVPVPVAPVAAVAVKPSAAWVAVPDKLQGPVLGQVVVLAGLEKGRPYVQLGSWATEAELLKVLDTVKSYVPLALYRAEGEKNPWKVIASAPKGQLGVLLALFKSEGFRSAAMVKG